LYDNLEKNEARTMAVDIAVRYNRQDDWRNNPFKVKKVRNAIREALLTDAARPSTPAPNAAANVLRERPAVYLTDAQAKKIEELVDEILSLAKNQHEY
jgi:hypothetical protein